MKPLSYYLLLITALLSLAFPIAINAQTLSSSVNRNEIGTNETLTLTVKLDQQVNSSELDLSSLQENFEILSATPKSRSSINIINGSSVKEASTTWTITLVAKTEGVLTIPAFTVRSASSRPITIKVSNSSQGKSSNQPLEVWVSTDVSEVFTNQQIVVKVELSAASNVRDLNGPQLVIPNADVEAFDQQSFQRVDNGISRQIVVLKYSVFASQAGTLTIPVMTYTGLENGRRSVFGSTGTQVIARSKQLQIEIKEPPSTGPARQWFPAEEVSVRSSWSADISKLKVGEPITRTITVTAKGQQASAIPPLGQANLDIAIKSYKDQPQLETTKTAQGFVATRVESEAIVANKAGSFAIPEMHIEWWNTKTKTWQKATLESQTLAVSGIIRPADTQENADTLAGHTPSSSGSTESKKPYSVGLWQMLSALLATIVLVQFYLLMRKQRRPSKPAKLDRDTESEQTNWTALLAAVKSDNSRAIRNNLLAWGRTAMNVDTPISIDTLAAAGGSQALRTLFTELDQHLYKGKKKPDYSTINSLLKDLRARLKESQTKELHSKQELKPLYPS